MSIPKLVWETLGLATPRGRWLFFILITLFVLFVFPHWSVNLSIWSHLGIPSPSIGMTRAYHKLLEGDILGAWHQNKLFFAVFFAVLVLLASDAVAIWRQRQKKV